MGQDLVGQVALVGGGSRGLGLLIARELAQSGATVAICARDGAELDRAAARLREETGAGVHPYVCDVTDREAVLSMVGQVERALGPVDLLFAVAGVIGVGPATSMTRRDYEEAMDIMFWGLLNLSDAVLPSMRERRRGRVAAITSIGGKLPVPHLLPYCAAKHAATGYFEGLRTELAGTGVTVTTVAPGVLRTGGHLHAEFTGKQEQEYAWFSLSATLPVLSLRAETAARRIVRSTLRGRRELLLSPMSKIGSRVHGIAPSTTIAVLSVAARLLPDDGREPGPRVLLGRLAERRLNSGLLRKVEVLGRRAAARFNE